MKKILALIAGAVFSLNAFASYTQYNFDTGHNVSGYFVQRDDNKAIAYYAIHVGGQYTDAAFIPNGYEDRIVSSVIRFSAPGPTGFTVIDNVGAYDKKLTISFETGALGYAAFYSQKAHDDSDPALHDISMTDHSAVIAASVDPALVALLDKNGGYFDGTFIGAQVPEPASLALFAIGALGAAGVARRRSKR